MHWGRGHKGLPGDGDRAVICSPHDITAKVPPCIASPTPSKHLLLSTSLHPPVLILLLLPILSLSLSPLFSSQSESNGKGCVSYSGSSVRSKQL